MAETLELRSSQRPRIKKRGLSYLRQPDLRTQQIDADLTVSIALTDKLTRPMRDATAALDKFGNTATRLTGRVAGLAKTTRVLASELQGVKAADGAAGAATASTGAYAA